MILFLIWQALLARQTTLFRGYTFFSGLYSFKIHSLLRSMEHDGTSSTVNLIIDVNWQDVVHIQVE